MRPYVSVVVPAYNEEENLRPTVEIVGAKLDELNTTFEIIIVNDGSADRTREIAEQICKDDGRVRLITPPHNIGPGSGVFTGIEAAEGEFVIFVPSDLALEPDDLKTYIDPSRDCDLVVGVRSDRRDYSIFRIFVSYVNIFLIKLLFRMKERQFNYISMYRTTMLNKINIESRGVFITAEIMIKARDLGYRLREIDVRYVPRTAGAATCGSPETIFDTVKDLFGFWLKRTLRTAVYLRSERNAGA